MSDSDYDCILVTAEMLVTPPTQSLEETDWQPDGRKPESADEAGDIDLEAMRKRLERLL